MENNTTQPYGENPNNYVAGLVEVDCFIDEQELIKAEYMLDKDKTNSYWSGRVIFLRDKIAVKKKIEQSLRDGTFNCA